VPNQPRSVLAAQAGIVAGFAFPVWVGDEIVAIFEFLTPSARPPDDELLEVVAHAGNQLGRVVERVRARDELSLRALQLEVANEELLELDRLKAEFLAVVSHELRTPLAVVLGYTRLLLEHWDAMPDTTKRAALADMHDQAVRLTRGVDIGLDIAQLEGGAIAARHERVKASHIIRRAIERSRPLEELVVDCPPELVVVADPELAARAVAELIDNACKYGAPPLQIRAKVSRGLTVIEVIDAGPGAPTWFETQLFERFAQASTGSTRTASGMGLGLVLAEALARVQGGDVWYRRPADGGPAFCVSLPSAPGVS
jgi:K+-sensing histidine kinase KdpD